MVFRKGNIPHNKGKTKDSYAPLKAVSEKVTITNKNNPVLINAVRKAMTSERNRKVSISKKKYWSIEKNIKRQSGMMSEICKTRNYRDENNPNYKHGNAVDMNKGIEIFEKSGKEFICENCGTTRGNIKNNRICIHHKDRNRKNNDLNNLQPLCQSCHAKLHITQKLEVV